MKNIKVDMENLDEKYKPYFKEEMTRQEISIAGTLILKQKLSNIKYKLLGWYYEKKHKKQN